MAACAATPIENGLIYHELQQLNQRLSVKVFQLNNLFDISRELTASFDEEAIKNLVTTTLMGHLMVSRCALYLRVPGGPGPRPRARAAQRRGRVLARPGGGARVLVLDALHDGDAASPTCRRARSATASLRARMALVVPAGRGRRARRASWPWASAPRARRSPRRTATSR